MAYGLDCTIRYGLDDSSWRPEPDEFAQAAEDYWTRIEYQYEAMLDLIEEDKEGVKE
jgi:hypothetical protein